MGSGVWGLGSGCLGSGGLGSGGLGAGLEGYDPWSGIGDLRSGAGGLGVWHLGRLRVDGFSIRELRALAVEG